MKERGSVGEILPSLFLNSFFVKTIVSSPVCSDDENLERRRPVTNEQQLKIMALRKQGYGHIKIGQIIGISDNTVRSFCRRNERGKSTKTAVLNCKQCGKQIKTLAGRKQRTFCSDACRSFWWNHHLESVNRKAFYDFECAHCGRSFSAYGNKSRRYCSHACYIAHRFEKGSTQDG